MSEASRKRERDWREKYKSDDLPPLPPPLASTTRCATSHGIADGKRVTIHEDAITKLVEHLKALDDAKKSDEPMKTTAGFIQICKDAGIEAFEVDGEICVGVTRPRLKMSVAAIQLAVLAAGALGEHST